MVSNYFELFRIVLNSTSRRCARQLREEAAAAQQQLQALEDAILAALTTTEGRCAAHLVHEATMMKACTCMLSIRTSGTMCSMGPETRVVYFPLGLTHFLPQPAGGRGGDRDPGAVQGGGGRAARAAGGGTPHAGGHPRRTPRVRASRTVGEFCV
jgi:hypothetical protein